MRAVDVGALPADVRGRLAQLYAEPAVRAVARQSRARHVGLWVVGGPVRDAVLGRESADLDLATSAAKADVRSLLLAAGGFGQVAGAALGTVAGMVRVDDVLTHVEITPLQEGPEGTDGGLRFDLTRRDLTVNALALDAVTGVLSDPVGGLGHIQDRVLDTPSDPDDTFAADPVRVLRVLRFEATLGFAVAPRVERALGGGARLLTAVHQPRVYLELVKMAQGAPGALMAGLLAARQRGMLGLLVPAMHPERLDLLDPLTVDLNQVLRELTAGHSDARTLLRECGVPRRLAQELVSYACAAPRCANGSRCSDAGHAEPKGAAGDNPLPAAGATG